jgi:hypothetical protein
MLADAVLPMKTILGKSNILYRPALDLKMLPSPAELVGKVIVKSKRPDNVEDTSAVLNDDFDDEIRTAAPPSYIDYDSEDDLKENVIGFKSTGTIKSPVEQKRVSLKELFTSANTEAVGRLLC